MNRAESPKTDPPLRLPPDRFDESARRPPGGDDPSESPGQLHPDQCLQLLVQRLPRHVVSWKALLAVDGVLAGRRSPPILDWVVGTREKFPFDLTRVLLHCCKTDEERQRLLESVVAPIRADVVLQLRAESDQLNTAAATLLGPDPADVPLLAAYEEAVLVFDEACRELLRVVDRRQQVVGVLDALPEGLDDLPGFLEGGDPERESVVLALWLLQRAELPADGFANALAAFRRGAVEASDGRVLVALGAVHRVLVALSGQLPAPVGFPVPATYSPEPLP